MSVNNVMKHKIMIFLSLVIILCYINLAYALPPLHVENQQLVDAHGRTVILHGVNLVNKQYPFTAERVGFSESTASLLHQYGFNVVRLGFIWQAIEPAPGVYNDAYLLQQLKTIKLLNQYGIYTLIDFHQDGYSSVGGYGLGAPDWATLATVSEDNIGFPLNYLSGLEVKGNKVSGFEADAFDAFWQNQTVPGENIGVQTAYLNMLAHVAQFYKNNSAIVGFEIMNEPFLGSLWRICSSKNFVEISQAKGCPEFDVNYLMPFTNAAIKSIQAVYPSAIVWYEPAVSFGMGIPTNIGTLSGDNLGFSFHNYCNKNLQLCMRNALPQRTINHAVLMATEFGANSLSIQQYKEFLSLADQYQINWIYWTLFNNPIYKFSAWPKDLPKDPREQGLIYNLYKPLKAGNVNWPVLDVLSRPYPQFVTGQIKSFHYDETRNTFKLRYLKNRLSNDESKNATVIFVPNHLYPKGYQALVTGGKIISSNNSERLEILNSGASNMTTVIISPRDPVSEVP